MIALLAGGDDFLEGPVPVALAVAGFLPRAVSSVDAARDALGRYGEEGCLLVVDAVALDSVRGAWAALVARHPRLAAVLLAHESEETGAVAAPVGTRCVRVGPRPDPLEVVAAVRRAATARPLHRVAPPLRWTG